MGTSQANPGDAPRAPKQRLRTLRPPNTRKTTPTTMTTTTTLLVAAMALALATSSARAQDIPDSCNDLDPSTLDTSNPAAFATILPCTGWDQTCQSNVMAANATSDPRPSRPSSPSSR